ncbi:MAG TPA: beta-galactosidase, partial [Alphaproteobacteria bacterium]|nr:beta-galactosidase [Alphaproteobacteria bacterium]
GWQTDNEFGCYETGKCYCDVCAARFREWLRARYGSLKALNEAWGTAFWSAVYSDWDEVPLPWAAPSEHNPAHVLDFTRFGSDATVEYQQVQIDVLRELAPEQFITHNFMPFHSRELDFYDVAAPLDLVSWDNYHFYGATPAIIAASHDLYRGMKGSGYWIMEQQVGNVNWGAYNPTLRPGEVGLKVWQSIAHGADGIVYFRWRAARFGAELYHSGLLDHEGQPTRGYAEAKELGEQVARLGRALEGSAPQAQVAFLHDYASRWSLDLQPHNKDLANDAAFERALMAPYEALWARHVPVDIVPAREKRDLSNYKLVILPALNLVSRDLASRLADYVQAGGTLVVTARSGFKDDAGQVPGRPPGHLAELLGIAVVEFDSLPPHRPNQVRFVGGGGGPIEVTHWFEVVSVHNTRPQAQPVAIYESDYYAGEAAATMRDVGSGRAIYVGLLAGVDFYQALFNRLLPQAGVEPLLPAGAAPAGVEIAARHGPAGRLLFVLNHGQEPVTVDLPAGAGSN